MRFGLRIDRSDAEVKALHALVALGLDGAEGTWSELTRDGPDARCVIACASFDADDAEVLRLEGLDAVRLAATSRGLAVTPLRAPREAETWEAVTRRDAPSLAELLRPRAIPGDIPPREAALWLPLDGDAPRRTLVRLLELGRDDVTARVLGEGDGRGVLLQLRDPPLYLLMRARDEPAEGVVAYARHRDTGLWVQWGYAHPLADAAAMSLRDKGIHALVGADGSWRRFDPTPPPRAAHDLAAPTIDARDLALSAAGEVPRFRVPLRLDPSGPSDPELWLLDAEGLLALEPLVEALSDDELRRFTLTRLADDRGAPTYLLRELVRPNAPRLAPRVAGCVDAPGYARAPGVENLFVPTGRRLAPPMRRDALRALLGLDRHRAVVIAEDGAGLTAIAVDADDESSLERWVDHVATDHRVELDRIAEESVFDWLPALSVEPPPTTAARDPLPPPPPSQLAPPPPRAERPIDPDAPARVAPAPPEDLALAARIAALSAEVGRGGCVNAGVWRELGSLLLRAGERDDGAACLEAAAFHGAPDAALTRDLTAARASLLERARPEATVSALAAATDLTPGEAAHLGALALALATRGDRDGDDEAALSAAARRFADPELPVSRRLAWAVLRAVHGARGDRLGLTRARERVLGAINARGLIEAADAPRFVRATLAAQGGDGAEGRGDQLAALESLWAAARASVREGEPRGAYVRMVFAVGFARLGATHRARDLAAPCLAELPRHAPANQALLRLYDQRAAHVATGGDDAAWARQLDAARAALRSDAPTWSRVEFLMKRSEWLRPPGGEGAPATIRSGLERAIVAAEGDPARLPTMVASALDASQHWDFEVGAAVERAVRAAIREGDDALLGAVLGAAVPRLATRMSSPMHRAQAIGWCIRGAAVREDIATVDALLAQVVAIAEAPRAPFAPDLLAAVTPALHALRRLGASASARRFLDALARVAERPQSGALQLRAAIADGLLQLGDAARAEAEIAGAVTAALAPGMDPVERFKSARDALAALRHFPLTTRLGLARAVVEALDRFNDAYTASAARLYETHKVLILERAVDAAADEATAASDRVRQWLDAEELEVRRRILRDGREACGP